MQRALSRAGERFSTLADVFRNPQLRRLELSWAGFYVGEWTYFVALSIYAFEVGGAAALGALGLARMIPAAIALPFGSVLTDRYARQRVLLGIHAGRGLLFGAIAVALAAESSRTVIFALAALAAVAGAPERPATLSLVPTLARTPRELVATNVSSSTLEGLGTLVGPVLGGVLAATAGVDVAVAVAAAVSALCALFVAGIRREGDVRGARRRVERNLTHELLGGVRTLTPRRPPSTDRAALQRADDGPRAAERLARRRVDRAARHGRGRSRLVECRARRRRAGRRAVGRRPRRSAPASRRLRHRTRSLGCADSAHRSMAAGRLGPRVPRLVGIGNALLDVSGFTLLQRTVDEHLLGRVFGVFEIGVSLATAVGSVLGSILVEQFGIRPALVVSGAILPFLALISLPGLRRIDGSAEVPERELELVSRVPLFSPLPATTLERIAARLEHVDVAAGQTVVEAGAVGDRFYLIAAGEIAVLRDGTTMTTLGAGDYFGEIALLHDVPRTATCTAQTDCEIYSLGREVFVAAVSGDVRSSAEAESVMSRRLEEQSSLRDGSPAE